MMFLAPDGAITEDQVSERLFELWRLKGAIANEDKYWLRMFSMASMQGHFSHGDYTYSKRDIVCHALDLLAEIKRVEAENGK